MQTPKGDSQPHAMRPAEALRSAGRSCVKALSPFTSADWHSCAALDLDWSVWDTAVHVNDDLYFYAAQVLLAENDDYVCFELKADAHASPRRLLAALRLHVDLLAGVVESTDPSIRGHHVYGVTDPDGFAAMGTVECLVQTYDVLRGLDPASTWLPPDDVAQAALTRLFRHAPTNTSASPGELLLHMCGRIPLDDRPRLTEWRWYGEPAPDASEGAKNDSPSRNG